MDELLNNYENEKKQIVEMSLKLLKDKLIIGTWGNLSIRVKEGDRDLIIITPTGMEYENILIEDLAVVDIDGNAVEGKRKPSSELKMHLAVYREREEINAVIHTHSTCASACSVCGAGIPMIVEDMVQHIGGNIRAAKYAMPGTEELAKNAVEALRDRKGALLKNHGAIGIGKDMLSAYKSCALIEKSSQILIYAKMLGHINLLSTEDADQMIEFYDNVYGQR